MNKDSKSEVTNRLRSAIKKKLSEISDFVDDELPEYIMILVANERSKSQMEKDLSLFLRDDTVKFTNWLWGLMNNMSIAPKSDNSLNIKSDSIVPKKQKDVDEDAIILEYDPDEQEKELLNQENAYDSILGKESPPPSSSNVQEEVRKEVEELKTQHFIRVKEKVKKEQMLEKKASGTLYSEIRSTRSQPKRNCKEQVSSKVVTVKKRARDSDDEYDPSKPAIEKSAAPRSYGGTAAFQANKLLLRAVDDATKSILIGQSIEDYYKPTPIKVLTSKRFRSSIPPRRETAFFRDSIQTEIGPNSDLNSDVSLTSGFHEQQYSNIFRNESSVDSHMQPNKGRTICLRNIPLVSDSPESGSMDFASQIGSELSFPIIEEVRPKSPHFIVTMEGVSLNSFKRKFDENSVESMDQDEEEMEIDEFSDEISPIKETKVSERCKYWPACKNSDNCLYHHPTIPCKCFPDCKYGDKCLYIHPNCKFDALCSRKDCPFTHASKRKLSMITPVKMMSRRGKAVCKYYPKCTVRNCAFIHPKLCRYGTECRLPACLFSHFPLPSRSQLKWQASDL